MEHHLVELAPTNMPYWGFDHEIDERAELLWWLAIRFGDVPFLVNQLSSVHDVTPPQIRLDYPSSDVITEILGDLEVLEAVIEVTDDARYEKPGCGDSGWLVFDAVLTERGNSVPVLLVVHEMAHHVEFMNTGRLGGHGDDFDELLRALIGQSMSMLNLDAWSDSEWLSFHPNQSRGSTPNEIYATNINAMKAKWSDYLVK